MATMDLEEVAIAAPSLSDALNLEEKFREALDSSHKLAVEDFKASCQIMISEVETKKQDLEKYFTSMSAQLEQSRQAFRTAQEEAFAAAEELQSVQAELNAHRSQGQKALSDMKVCLIDLLQTVRGYTVRHVLCGSGLVAAQVALVLVARSQVQRMKNSIVGLLVKNGA